MPDTLGDAPLNPQSALIDRLLETAEARYAPDIRAWKPQRRVDSNMRIAADGRWFHRGGEIKRPEMVKLFAALLRREEDEHFLVTPVEKAFIEVEDMPFLIVDFEIDGEGREQRLLVRTNLEEWVPVRHDGQLRMTPVPSGEGNCPCAEARPGLMARFTRAANFRFADLLLERDGWLGVWSYGTFYPMVRESAAS